MTQPSGTGRSTQVSTIIKASRALVYRAFLEAHAMADWLPPDGMTGHVHTFEPRAGGQFCMSLTYINPENSLSGKTSADTDIVMGRFTELITNEKIVWISEFDSEQPEFAGEMTITWNLADAAEGTEVTVLCEDIPTGIRLEDNEMGSRSSLQNLAAFVERSSSDSATA